MATLRPNQIPADLGPTQLIAVSSLRFPRSLRKYTTAIIKQAARFTETFGMRLPILVDAERNIIAGEIWALAAKRLELPEIPALFVEGLSPDQLNAYRIGIQRIPELGGWDEARLGDLFRDWSGRSLDFDIEIAGFSMPEIDTLVGQLTFDNEEVAADHEHLPLPGAPVSKLGDLWQLGRHKILCGNSLEAAAFERLMGAEKASVVITDPPYNVPIDGHAVGKGNIHHREFEMASGEMTSQEFVVFLRAVMQLLAQFSLDGSLHYLFMDWRHAMEILTAGGEVYSELKNIICWVKTNPGMGSLYRSQHELTFLFKNGRGRHRNNVELGKHGRNRSNVWNYAGATSPSGRQTDEGHVLSWHPTVKPVQMLADALLDSSARGEIAIDSFLGSGSTLIAAEQVGRRLFGLEIDPGYVDVAVRRWERITGEHAVHNGSSRTFAEISAERAAQPNVNKPSR